MLVQVGNIMPGYDMLCQIRPGEDRLGQVRHFRPS
jgi:hypothetical protein